MAEIVSSKPINEVDSSAPRNRSSFDLGYRFYNTQRFGEYTPHFWMEGVDNDTLPLRSSHRVMSYTLATPLLSDVKMKKDYFYVPMMCILPLNWNKFITQPSIGQDVPADCGPSVADFWAKMSSIGTSSLNYLDTILSSGGSGTETAEQCLDACFKFFVFFERIYSDGSLMSNLGIHGGHYWRSYRTTGDREMISFDQWMDSFISLLITVAESTANPRNTYFSFTDGTTTFYVELAPSSAPVSTSDNLVSLRDYLEFLRDDFTWTISTVGGSGTQKSALISLWNAFRGQFSLGSGITPFIGTSGVANDDKPALDLRRLWAYQIVCAHFFTNDKVDYVYSAELFRQYIQQLVTRKQASGTDFVNFFTVNGLEYLYDALSAYYCNKCITGLNGSSGIFAMNGTAADSVSELYAYFRSLFGFNRSLRYKDYFTGSRTRALAVGNTDVQVNSNLVNVIDVTRSIQAQRFLNWVNKIPRQFEDYFAGLMHKRPAPDYHNPFFLAETVDDVFGEESEYTGNVADAEQNNITSVLKSNADRYAFEFSPDRDCVVIGLTSYDIPRAYSASIERQAMHYDRFDAFNPFYQFIGDQAVYQAEIGSALPSKYPFGYQIRHCEYKERFDQCAGGFRKFLPGWLFIADDDLRKWIAQQGPSFIRSHNTEFDRFYKSLTGYSLGSYFHFIVKNTNTMKASRPMAYQPGILE